MSETRRRFTLLANCFAGLAKRLSTSLRNGRPSRSRNAHALLTKGSWVPASSPSFQQRDGQDDLLIKSSSGAARGLHFA